MSGAAVNAAVIGASGGIGAALTTALAARGIRVAALSRSPERSPADAAQNIGIDILEEGSIAAAARSVHPDADLDLVIVATGMLHEAPAITPEKRLEEFDAEAMSRVLAVNAIAPAILARYFLPRLRRDRKAVFAALSARVGSIGDNRLGGWASYRASKAALNMLLRTLAIEMRRRNPCAIIAALHPGTVVTPLSAPFQGNVPDGQLFAPARAADQLLGVIDGLGESDSGGFFAWDGKPIPW